MTVGELVKGHEALVIKEMADKCKDVIFMNAERRMAQCLQQVKCRDVDDEDDEDKLHVTYNFYFIIGDFVQAIGRKKRTNGKITIEDLIAK